MYVRRSWKKPVVLQPVSLRSSIIRPKLLDCRFQSIQDPACAKPGKDPPANQLRQVALRMGRSRKDAGRVEAPTSRPSVTGPAYGLFLDYA